MRLADVHTPALVLDRQRLQANLARMAARAKALGVALRPHLKTAKSAPVARLAVAGQPGGITVSTLAEARYFAEHGFRDITYAVGMVPGKLEQVAALRRSGVALTIVVDSIEAASAIANHSTELDCEFDVLIELDTGGGRAGVRPTDEVLVDIADAMRSNPSVRLLGVITHAGHSYHCTDTAEIAGVAEMERAGAVGAAERLRQAGHAIGVVSVGSTPTACHATGLAGVTEMRPGVYMFGDRFQVAIGSCAESDMALSVLATVIGYGKDRDTFLIDAGVLALSQDRSMDEIDSSAGYGAVYDAAGLCPFSGMRVLKMNQEHGFIGPVEPANAPFTLRIGQRVRIFPNHACITAAGFDNYHVLEGDHVVDIWDRCRGW